MIKVQLLDTTHEFAANTYLISSGDEYAVVDPTCPPPSGLASGRVKYILLTHAHFDHIWEVDSWVEETGARVICSLDELEALSDPMRNCFKLYNGTDNGYFGPAEGITEDDRLPFGDSEISLIRCPGHTYGSATFLLDGCAFVGDTIFERGGFGRFDLPTGSYHMLRTSIERLMKLPEDTVVYPGHGGTTTIGQYKLDFTR